ncbi:hypothetical protein EDF44_2521 [Rathayibacter sp. PhB185]|nr:hypothetical protein EDF45_2527 [Rathayibacter sp. PhB186]ROS50688.1 hypothetical protein EDF44_2521 [Rathayibacter sp. PhB185]
MGRTRGKARAEGAALTQSTAAGHSTASSHGGFPRRDGPDSPMHGQTVLQSGFQPRIPAAPSTHRGVFDAVHRLILHFLRRVLERRAALSLMLIE